MQTKTLIILNIKRIVLLFFKVQNHYLWYTKKQNTFNMHPQKKLKRARQAPASYKTYAAEFTVAVTGL